MFSNLNSNFCNLLDIRNLQEYVKKAEHTVTKIVLPYYEKKCSSDQKKMLKFEAEGQEFAIFF